MAHPAHREWLVEKNWYMIDHWEDKLCRDAYQEFRDLPVREPLRVVAMLYRHSASRSPRMEYLGRTRCSTCLGFLRRLSEQSLFVVEEVISVKRP